MKNARIRGRVALRIDQPGAGQRLAGDPLLLRVTHAGDRRRHVDHDRIARGRQPRGNGIRCNERRHTAMGHDRGHRRIRAFDDRDQSLLGRTTQICGETRDVVRMANHNGAGAAHARHCRRTVERAQCQPRTGKALAIPHFRGPVPTSHFRLAILGHPSFGELFQIRREQRQAVRRVPEKIGIEQHIGHIPRDVGAHSRVRGQFECEVAQIVDTVTRRLVG